jgi:hypothetical protein
VARSRTANRPPVTESAPSQAAHRPPNRESYPVEIPPQAEQVPLPSLQESDATVLAGIAGVVGSDAFDRIVRREDIVRRIVATVDNLPRHSVAPRMMPVQPIPGRFATAGGGDGLTIAADNAARYAPYVRMAEAVEMKTFAALYMRFYPLFQEAYRDLSYSGYFNDRLVEGDRRHACRPIMSGPVKLSQPRSSTVRRSEPRAALGRAADHDAHGQRQRRARQGKLARFRREIVGPQAKP